MSEMWFLIIEASNFLERTDDGLLQPLKIYNSEFIFNYY